jgi:hypothetical protein
MLFVGDDWAEDHHDVYVMNADGARLASRRLPEGGYQVVRGQPVGGRPLSRPPSGVRGDCALERHCRTV